MCWTEKTGIGKECGYGRIIACRKIAVCGQLFLTSVILCCICRYLYTSGQWYS